MRRCLVRAMYLSAFVVACVYLGRYIKCSTFTSTTSTDFVEATSFVFNTLLFDENGSNLREVRYRITVHDGTFVTGCSINFYSVALTKSCVFVNVNCDISHASYEF